MIRTKFDLKLMNNIHQDFLTCDRFITKIDPNFVFTTLNVQNRWFHVLFYQVCIRHVLDFDSNRTTPIVRQLTLAPHPASRAYNLLHAVEMVHPRGTKISCTHVSKRSYKSTVGYAAKFHSTRHSFARPGLRARNRVARRHSKTS